MAARQGIKDRGLKGGPVPVTLHNLFLPMAYHLTPQERSRIRVVPCLTMRWVMRWVLV